MNIYHDKTEHFNALQRWLCTPFKIINGDGFAEVNGELIPVKEYDRHNEKPTYEDAPRENPDSRRIAGGIVPPKSRR